MITLYVLFNAGLAAILLWGRHEATTFLASHSVINSVPAMEAFKRLARRNMIGALIFIPLGLVSIVWSVYLGFRLGLVGVAVVLAVQIPLFALGRNLKKYETRARSMGSSDATLAEEHQRISETWVKKAVPDF